MCILSFFFLYTQEAKAQAIGNQQVIELVESGLPTSVIIKKIKSSPTAFDLSTDALVELTNAKVPEDIMNVMLEIGESEADEYADIKALMPKFGIYLVERSGSEERYNFMEPTVVNKIKEGGMGNKIARAYTSAAKNKIRAILLGAYANQSVSTNPEFYFLFSPDAVEKAAEVQQTNPNDPNAMMTQMMAMAMAQQGMGGGVGATFNQFSNPNQFMLVKMDVKKDERIFVASSYSGAGSESGVSGEDAIRFKFEDMGKSLYKVYFSEPLEEGEYVFVYAGIPIGQGQEVFDFSVRLT